MVVAGDFNSVPPEATLRKAFPDEPETDFTTDSTVTLLRQGFDGTDLLASAPLESSGFTFPADAPNRRLDHAFVGSGWRAATAEVLRPASGLSDHLPLLIKLNAGSASAQQPKKPKNGRPSTNASVNTDLKPGDITVDVRAPERLQQGAPVQEKTPPPPPQRLNPKDWLKDAPALKAKEGQASP